MKRYNNSEQKGEKYKKEKKKQDSTRRGEKRVETKQEEQQGPPQTPPLIQPWLDSKRKEERHRSTLHPVKIGIGSAGLARSPGIGKAPGGSGRRGRTEVTELVLPKRLTLSSSPSLWLRLRSLLTMPATKRLTRA